FDHPGRLSRIIVREGIEGPDPAAGPPPEWIKEPVVNLPRIDSCIINEAISEYTVWHIIPSLEITHKLPLIRSISGRIFDHFDDHRAKIANDPPNFQYPAR